MEIYDCAVIGSGPAGASAAINLKLYGKKFLWFSGKTSSDKVLRAPLIKNYPGLPDVTGKQLGWAIKNHCESMDINPVQGIVTGIYDLGDKFTLTVGKDSYDSKTVILCTGVWTAAQISGEDEFLGRGVSYCATCDGFLYRGKTIAVIAYDKIFEDEADYLVSLAGKSYVFPLYENCDISSKNAQILTKTPTAFAGGERLEKVIFNGGEISVDGAFVLKSAIPAATLLHGLKCDGAHISVDRGLNTNIKGVFAAGDCTGRPYQYAKAVGEGNVAAHSAIKYLASKNE